MKILIRQTISKLQRTLSVNSNDATTSEKSTTHGGKSKHGCKCKTGCKAANCGCHKNQIGCTDNCFCKSGCKNVFNASFSGVETIKRTLSQDTESTSEHTGPDDDKENRADESMHTPKKIRYV